MFRDTEREIKQNRDDEEWREMSVELDFGK